MGIKKRKISGLSSIELSQAHASLVKLRKSLILDEDQNEEGDVSTEVQQSESFVQALDDTIAQMESRLNGPQIINFSTASEETLQELNIVGDCGIILKPNHEERAAEKSRLGRDKTWSSDTLHSHIALLKQLVPSVNASSVRLWIDAFFFRVSAMVPEDQRMVLNTEPGVPATLSGYADYTAVIADARAAALYFDGPWLTVVKKYATAFFVTEAKSGVLYQYLPQALCEMYASAKQIRQSVIRGALSNGKEWMFLILRLNEDGYGASYMWSNAFSCVIGGTNDATPDLIAGILSDWIPHGFSDLSDDDWFEKVLPLGRE